MKIDDWLRGKIEVIPKSKTEIEGSQALSRIDEKINDVKSSLELLLDHQQVLSSQLMANFDYSVEVHSGGNAKKKRELEVIVYRAIFERLPEHLKKDMSVLMGKTDSNRAS